MKNNFDKESKKFFNNISSFYNSRINKLLLYPFHKNLLQYINKNINFKEVKEVLDTACGPGKVMNRLATDCPTARFYGIDFSEKMIELAKQKNSHLKNTEFIVSDVTKMPFNNVKFDVLICAEALHHFSHPVESLLEFYRVLKPNGKLIISEPHFKSRVGNFLADKIIRPTEKAVKYYSKEEINDLGKKAGFKYVGSSKKFINIVVEFIK